MTGETGSPGGAPAVDVLSSVWERVLGIDSAGSHGDLMALGGGWFEAAQASSLVRDALGVDVTPAEVAGARTPAALAPLVERRRQEATGGAGAGDAPVAVSQEGMVWHEQLVPGSFNLAPLVRRLRGRLDQQALRAAFEEMAQRHEPLRTNVQVRNSRPVQVVADAPAPQLPLVDLSGMAAAGNEARQMISDAARRPFDLAAEPLFQPSLIRFGADDHLLVVRLHHTVFDDWSVTVYRRELSALYAAYSASRAPSLPPLPVGFTAYAWNQRRHLAGVAGAAELTWWRNQLRGAPFTTQIAVGPPAGEPARPSRPVDAVLPPGVVTKLRALAVHGRATLFMTLLAGFQVLLHRRTGQDDLVIASVLANRDDRQLEGLIGCFTKKVPLRLRLDGEPTFLELLTQVRQTVLAAWAHGGLGFETVLQETLGRQAAGHGLVAGLPIMFQGLVPPRARLHLPGVTGSPFGSADSQGPGMHVAAREEAQAELAARWGEGLYPGTFLGLSVIDDGQGVTLRAQGVFHPPAVETLLAEFRSLLAEIVSRPLCPVTDLLRTGTGPVRTERFRGFRLDRHRLEQALATCSSLAEARLAVRAGADGPRLTAGVVPRPGREPTRRQLRACLWRQLPGSLWPAEFLLAEEPAGKPCPAGEPSGSERLLTSAWAAALGVPEVRPDANYWQSFSFLAAVAAARERGQPILPEQVARNRTAEMLAADLVASREAPNMDTEREAGRSPDGPLAMGTARAGDAGSNRAVAIRAEGLSKTYPNGITAVDALDLSVGEGEIFGLLGPNGAGKTTTVGMLTTLVIPTAGRAFVGGVDVVADPALAKQYFGVVPQANNLDHGLTVFQNLYFHGRYFGMGAKRARARAGEMLERFRLGGRGGDPLEHLSGGMLRRLQLARALMHDPAVAFLDEPTAGLDPQSRLALWDIVAGLRAEGQTVVLTTHYIEEAERFCDRVAIMDRGRILALDTPGGLKRTYKGARIILVRGAGPFDLLGARLGGFAWVDGTEPVAGGLRIRLGPADGALSSVMAQAEQVGVKVSDVSMTEGSLEAAFIELTGRELRE